MNTHTIVVGMNGSADPMYGGGERTAPMLGGSAPRRSTRLTVADVMTRDVVTTAPETPFKQIEQLMAEHRVSALPVVDSEGVVVGVVSEADLLLKAEAEGGESAGWGPGPRRRDFESACAVSGRLDVVARTLYCTGCSSCSCGTPDAKRDREATSGSRGWTPGRHREPR